MKFLYLLIVILSLIGCKKLLSPNDENKDLERDPVSEVVYSNDFNSSGDTSGFTGYGYWKPISDTLNQEIRQCLFVTGGCPFPHVKIDLPEFGEGKFILQLIGRKLDDGGSVTLLTNDNKEISIIVKDSFWTFYQSSDTLRGESDDQYYLWLNSGGIKAASMLVDDIKVRKL